MSFGVKNRENRGGAKKAKMSKGVKCNFLKPNGTAENQGYGGESQGSGGESQGSGGESQGYGAESKVGR